MKRIVRKSKKAFVELWRRIEEGQFPYTKGELCSLVGVSPRWAEHVVATERRST